MTDYNSYISNPEFNLHLIPPFRHEMKFENPHHIVTICRYMNRQLFHFKYCEEQKELKIDIEHLKKETKWNEQMIIEALKWLSKKQGKFNIE